MRVAVSRKRRVPKTRALRSLAKVVVLAGGRGTRLRPYTHVLPKPLMPIGELPILEVVIRRLALAGLREIILATGYLSELIEAYFHDGRRFGVSLAYWREDQPLGTAGPLAAIGGLDDTFLMMNGDVLTDVDFVSLLAHHRRQRAIATVTTYHQQVHVDSGVLKADAQGVLQEYTEKPVFDYLISAGIYAFEPSVVQWIPRAKLFNIPELLMALRHAGHRVSLYEHTGYWLDIGRPEDYEVACREFQERRERFLPDGRASSIGREESVEGERRA